MEKRYLVQVSEDGGNTWNLDHDCGDNRKAAMLDARATDRHSCRHGYPEIYAVYCPQDGKRVVI